MDRSDTPTLLVPLLALLALVFPFAMTSRSPGTSGENKPQVSKHEGQQSTPPCPNDLCPHSAAKLLENFLQAQTQQQGEQTLGELQGKYKLHFLIATLPDPIDSGLPYFFDSFLGSIQRAFEAGGYVLDRFDLAWPEPGGAPEEAKKNPLRYRREPSLLLFRNTATDTDAPQSKLFLVFVVGETPTGGLHKAAMASALKQLSDFYPWGTGYHGLPKELRDLTAESPGTTVEVLGPTFSGSAISLDFALQDWLVKIHGKQPNCSKPAIIFRIVSGTATAIDSEDFSHIGCSSSFHAVVPPDKQAFPAILGYLSSLHYKKAALLVEANTAYGRQTIEPGGVRLLSLPFPLQISQLRTASEEQRLAQESQKSNPSVKNNSTLPIPSAEAGAVRPTTTPPSFSNLDVPSAEMVLSRLLSTISHEGYHAVGIMATGERDTVFLAREIHQHCPGTLVFTVNADLLYTHPDVSASTRGMLVFTPYPLFNLDQIWTPPFQGQASRLQFPNQAAEGVYNATLELLGMEYVKEQREEEEPGEGKEVDPRQGMLDYGRPFPPKGQDDAERPELWVTVMGRNGPLPVDLLSWQDPENYAVSEQRDAQASYPEIDQEGIYTSTSALGIVLLGILIFFFSWAIFRQYRSPRNLVRAPRLFREPVTREYRPQARLFLFASLTSPLSLFVVMGAIYFLPAIVSYRLGSFFYTKKDNAAGWWGFAALLALVALVVAAGLLALGCAVFVVFRAFWKSRRRSSLLRWIVRSTILFGCLLVLGLSVRFARAWLIGAAGEPLEAVFRYVRAFEFSSGLSPLVPLACLAVAGFLWAFSSFWRLRMIDGMRGRKVGKKDPEGLLKTETTSFSGVKALETKVRERLERASAFSTGWYIGLMVAGLFGAAYLFFDPLVLSDDGQAFYFLFGWGFFLVYAALTMEFGRLCLTWSALRRLLQRLALHPMQAAYERYRKSFPGLPRIDLAGSLQTFAVLSHSVDQAEQLLRLALSLVASPTLPDAERQTLRRWLQDPRLNVKGAATSLSEALECDANGKWRLAIKKRSQCQNALGMVTELTAQSLEPSWRAKTNSAPPDKESPEFQTFRELGEEFLAGRTVLLLSYVLPALRNLGTVILSGLLLMLFSVISYPFLQRNHFLVFNWVVILGFVGLAVAVMVQMERDVVLSALNGTAAGQVTLTRHFTFRVLTYVMVPLLALLGAQFPDTVGKILSWFNSTPVH